jgi:hypothetical protein
VFCFTKKKLTLRLGNSKRERLSSLEELIEVPEAVETLEGDLERIVIVRTPEGKAADELGVVGRRNEVSKEKSGPSGTPADLEVRLASRIEEL